MRWGHLHAMNQLKLIIAKGRTRLREEQHIAITHTRHSDAVATAQQVARCITIAFHHLLVFLWQQGLMYPLLIRFLIYPHWMRLIHEALLCSFGIVAQHQAICLDALLESLQCSRQSVHVITFSAQAFQEVVERRYHLHATGEKGILSRILEVADGDAFLAVGHTTQRHVFLQVCEESLYALWLYGISEITLCIWILCGEGVRSHASVYFWDDHTGIQ